jgi:hypothetical protein
VPQVTIVRLTGPLLESNVGSVNVDLDFEQLAQLELISMHAGKAPAQLLMEAALLVLNRDADLYDDSVPAEPQKFLPEPEMEARLARILRRC